MQWAIGMKTLTNSFEVSQFIRECSENFESEEFWAVAVNSRCEVLGSRMLFRGTVDQCLVHPRDVFRFAIHHNAASILIGHTHPSGFCRPSFEDVRFTRDLREAGQLLKIPVLDHVIVTKDEHFSFADTVWRLNPKLGPRARTQR